MYVSSPSNPVSYNHYHPLFYDAIMTRTNLSICERRIVKSFLFHNKVVLINMPVANIPYLQQTTSGIEFKRTLVSVDTLFFDSFDVVMKTLQHIVTVNPLAFYYLNRVVGNAQYYVLRIGHLPKNIFVYANKLQRKQKIEDLLK